MTMNVGVIEYIDDCSRPLADSLALYLRNVLYLREIDPNIKILLVEIDHNWEVGVFYDEIIKIPRKDNIKGILFFSMEPFPRGDAPSSSFNNSRMLREFFENSFNAVTANHENLLSQLYCLIYKIMKSDFGDNRDVVQSFQSAINQLDNLLNQIIILKQNKLDSDIQKNNIKIELNSLSSSYPFGGIHTQDGHNYFRKFIEGLKNDDSIKIEEYGKKIYKMGMCYDLASIFASNPLQYEKEKKDGLKRAFKILVIDDNIENIKNDLNKIMEFFPKASSIYITERDEWKKFLYGKSFREDMCNRKAKLSLIELNKAGKKDKKYKDKQLFIVEKKRIKNKSHKKFIFDFIVVDLLMGDYNEGNQIINNLENFRNVLNRNSKKKEERTYFDIIALSLSEEAHDISRALNEGALCYVPKKRIFMLPAVVAKLEKSRRIIESRADQFKSIQKSRNFGKLYRLPEIIKRRLQTEPFLNLLFPENLDDGEKIVAANLNPYLKEVTKDWIKNMPKADLHCHLGGSIDADTAFFLSLNMLAHYCSKENANHKDFEETLSNMFERYFDFISYLVWGDFSNLKNLFQIVKILLDIIHKFDIDKPAIGNTRKKNIIDYMKEKKEASDTKIADIYSIILNRHNQWFEDFLKQIQGYLKNSNIKKESPDKIIAEKVFFGMLKHLEVENKKNIPLPDPVNIFNVLIGVIEGKTLNDINEFWEKIQKLSNFTTPPQFAEQKKFLFEKDIPELISENRVLFEIIKTGSESRETVKDAMCKNMGETLLGYYISAEKRQTHSLAEYLGGNEFMGSEQLQYKENIVAALYSIIEKNIEDNVRYLEIRLSPDGYIKMGLTLQEAVQTLLSGTDLITHHFYYLGKFIRVNFIFSIKRHKAPQEAALEISAAIVNREREKYLNDIKPKITPANIHIQGYDWKPSKVMGIDLAGLEKGNPAQNFVSDFSPLFKTSSFITIHAGEEDTAQSIWAAVYLLHADRIGHGLTLQEIPELKEMFKNLQICIEMNPISNTLTNPNIEDHYPFYDFFKEGLKITINTDNSAVSGSSLSDEFVKAGELFQKHRENTHQELIPHGKSIIHHEWISKWETFRVIKNGFSSAFLDREEKRQLIRAVEEEIYQKIIKEYEC